MQHARNPVIYLINLAKNERRNWGGAVASQDPSQSQLRITLHASY